MFMMAAVVPFVGMVLACGGGGAPDEGPIMAPGTPPDPTPAPANGSDKTADPATENATDKPADEATPSKDAACTDDCLLLLRFDHRDLSKGAYCDTCGSDDCDGWPPEKLACDEVDRLRNCMYARLGYTFDKADEWREVFDKEAWYIPRDDFEWTDVSPIQKRNADWLRAKRKNRDCTR